MRRRQSTIMFQRRIPAKYSAAIQQAKRRAPMLDWSRKRKSVGYSPKWDWHIKNGHI